MSQNQKDAAVQTVSDPEVKVRAKRRQFSAQEKLRILNEADSCQEPGQVGALLRREGIYSSYLTDWRQELKNGQIQGLKAQLAQAELIISAQKKLAQALEQTLSRNKSS
jgi:transposase-like protein